MANANAGEALPAFEDFRVRQDLCACDHQRPVSQARARGSRQTCAARKAAGTAALAEAMPSNPIKAGEFGEGVRKPPSGKPLEPEDESRHRQHAFGKQSLAETRLGQPDGRIQLHHRSARSRARGWRRPRAHHQPGRARRRQPELAQGGFARPRAARRFHPAREDHALRPRADSRAHRARARLRRARLSSSATSRSRRSRAPRCSPKPASARRCSCGSRPWPANAARPTPRATCAASPSSSTPTKATGISSATTSRCSSSRTR